MHFASNGDTHVNNADSSFEGDNPGLIVSIEVIKLMDIFDGRYQLRELEVRDIYEQRE